MSQIMIFENKEFGKIRTVAIDGEPWMVGKDVAQTLGYSDTKSALSAHVCDDDKQILQRGQITTFDIPNRGLTIINESGLYSLVLSSKLPSAKKFKHWVTFEVLPSIRKHGGYIVGQETMSDEELLSRALLMAQSKIEERDRQIAALKAEAELNAPKVAFADAVHNATTDITVEKYTKLLYDKHGLRIGRNKMFKLLRTLGYLQDNNIPYQRYLESGYFTTCEVLRNGQPYVVTLVTGKGQTKLFNKIMDIM